MTKEAKIQHLELLRNEIISTLTDTWLFPTLEPVQGFLGNGPVMFVGERPSTGSFNDKPARLLYSLLEKYGVADSHLTDVIKTREKVGQPYPEDMSPHWRIFNREIEIVEPRLIIAFGPKVYDLLQFSLAGSGVKLQVVRHYSSTRWGAERVIAFDEQIRQAVATDQSILNTG